MTDSRLAIALSQATLLADGAMGTQLQLAGLEPGGCGEAWNVDHPDRVTEIQRRYVEAGVDCLITNTFGGSRIMLERHDAGDRVQEINRAAVTLAREAFGDRRGFVLGDIGPFGGLLEPYGEFSESTVSAAFEEQARALLGARCDAIVIETQTSLEELGLAMGAARAAGAPCIIASMAFDALAESDEVRTMMGVSPEQAAQFMADEGADVIGLNCGTGIDMVRAADTVARFRSVSELPIIAQPNAGEPVLEQTRVVYRQTPEEMAAGIPGVVAAGAGIVGGCCGSTPDHIAALRRALDRGARAIVEPRAGEGSR